jgi:gliotoxin/aspirochlorine/mycotoxins biosynthesis cytochrome P450 monooxygenase
MYRSFTIGKVYSLPEITAEPKVIRGFHVPANTPVLIDAFTLNRKSDVWGPDGEAFRPERFAALGMSPTQYRYAFWRFGLGPRKCLGQHFGDMIIKSCVFQIFANYKVELGRSIDVFRDRFVQTADTALEFSLR